MFLKLRPDDLNSKIYNTYIYIYIHMFTLKLSKPDWKQHDVKQRKRKPVKRCIVMFCTKKNADGVSLHQFPLSWMLDNTSGFCLQLFHCNILQIFIFDQIYFLPKMFSFSFHIDWQSPHWHLVIKKVGKVAIFLGCWIEEIENTTCLIGFTKRNSYQLGAKTRSKQ